MVDYKTFKKEYLTEWVDKSQAARKAAEELANKEVSTSLRDKYKFIFDLAGHAVEFKTENETNSDGSPYFTGKEATERFKKPDADGWRLPTKEELKDLRCNFPCTFNKDSGSVIFNGSLILHAEGFRTDNEILSVGTYGSYWSSTPAGYGYTSTLVFDVSGLIDAAISINKIGRSVRLVRDVNN